MKDIQDALKIIAKGADEIIPLEGLKEKLEKSSRTNQPLIIKLGLDPSAPDIHLGHTVVLRKMRQLQDLGHQAVIIIGDFTGKIGDPTGKSKSRKPLTDEEVLANAKTYTQQLIKVLDPEKTTITFNSEWLNRLNFEDVIKLAATTTVARMLEREDFKVRYAKNEPIGIHEFLYPLMQGYDSVHLKADIEIGGTDQRFNLLMGRSLQKESNQDPQVVIMMPILEGLDGIEKMSKSLGNYIGIDEPPNVMYQKTMTIPDELITKYYALITDIHPDILLDIENELEASIVNKRDIKMSLAKEITTLYWGAEKALYAEQEFINVFQKKDIPADLQTLTIDVRELSTLSSFITGTGLVKSNSEFRRLIEQGAVRINEEKVEKLSDVQWLQENILQIGKSKFLKIIINHA